MGRRHGWHEVEQMILVDSSVWIAYFNGSNTRQADLLNDLLNREPILIGDLIMAEVFQGFHSASKIVGG